MQIIHHPISFLHYQFFYSINEYRALGAKNKY